MRTRNDLVRLALKNLGALPQGQDPSAEEQNSVDGFIDGMLLDLAARDVVFVADAEAIPDEAFNQLGVILAAAARSEFGVIGDIEATIVKASQEAEGMLIRAHEGVL